MVKTLLNWLRRSLENPSVPLSAGATSLDSTWSESSVHVSQGTALGLSGFWRGINLVSAYVAKTDLRLMRVEVEEGFVGRKPATRHSVYPLMLFEPNDETTAYYFKNALQSHAMMFGNGYGLINRNTFGTPEEVIQLQPQNVTPMRVMNEQDFVSPKRRNRGELRYLVGLGDSLASASQFFTVPKDDIIHIKGLTPDGLVGYSVIAVAADSLGLSIAENRHASRYFRQGANPSLVVEFPGSLSKPAFDNIVKSWEAVHQGYLNNARPLILEAGAKAASFTPSAEASQLLESRRFSLIEIANWVGVPAHKIGAEQNTSYASLESENQAFLDDNLDPWFTVWESECRRKLLSPGERKRRSHDFRFDRESVKRVDLSAMTNYLSTAYGGPWLQLNEARALDNRNPLDDGDVLTTDPRESEPEPQPPAPAPGQDTPPPEIPPEPPQEPDGRDAGLIQAVCRNALKRTGEEPAAFMRWLANLESNYRHRLKTESSRATAAKIKNRFIDVYSENTYDTWPNAVAAVCLELETWSKQQSNAETN